MPTPGGFFMPKMSILQALARAVWLKNQPITDQNFSDAELKKIRLDIAARRSLHRKHWIV
jgi:hypothetical protein